MGIFQKLHFIAGIPTTTIVYYHHVHVSIFWVVNYYNISQFQSISYNVNIPISCSFLVVPATGFAEERC